MREKGGARGEGSLREKGGVRGERSLRGRREG